ncbi:hypothetical protein [Rhizobium sp. C4]|uniref:hypothetical protein n=1 Tax=Rhizobium sp. C4 TaxID=1349800 RepID=UPI001E43FB51|nr:hypothetical protein [Rhizobium sp. C4]MCD2175353.1 hypothetical protein [Rhizobium sp. C4]
MFEKQVRERVEAVLTGEAAPEDLTGATSVRCSVGLILGTLEGITTLSERDAWNYLDRVNVTMTHRLSAEYWPIVKEWERHRGRNAAF